MLNVFEEVSLFHTSFLCIGNMWPSESGGGFEATNPPIICCQMSPISLTRNWEKFHFIFVDDIIWTARLLQSLFLLTQSWMGRNGIFWSPDKRQALFSRGTCSQQFANIWTSFFGSESPKAKIVTLALMRHGPKGSSRPPWQTSSRKRICLRSEFIFIPNARLLRTSDKSPPHLKTGIKMNTPARAEHSCALHLVGDLLRHLLHHLPRPLPLLWHRVLQLFVVLLFLWEERFSFLSPCFVLSLF